MTVTSGRQLVLNFDPGLTGRYRSALEAVRDAAYKNRHPLKTIAAEMDMSGSDLSRKLGGNPNDPRQFTLNDLEAFLDATGDMSPLFYLVEKYLADQEAKQKMALQQIAEHLPNLLHLVEMVKSMESSK